MGTSVEGYCVAIWTLLLALRRERVGTARYVVILYVQHSLLIFGKDVVIRDKR